MSLVSDADILSFLGVQSDYFIINSGANVIMLKYNAGASTAVTIADGTYTGTELAALIKAGIDSAFTITSTVSWSSSTRKFTITVALNTIQYIASGSDLGTAIGFTANSLATLSITSDTACGDPTAEVLFLRDAIEAQIEKECRRTFTSTTYTLEKYSGTDSSYLYLKNYPITNIAQFSIGTQDAILVWNTSADTLATIAVTSTAIVLNKDGATDTLLFADYATLALITAAINAAGDGWQAQISSSTFNSYKSTQLIKRFGASAINSTYVYLQIPYLPQTSFDVDEDQGIIISGGFSGSAYVTYTAGYTTIPDDLQYLVKMMVKHNYSLSQNGIMGLSSYRIGDLSFTFDKSSDGYSVPKEVAPIMSKYKKRLV